MTRSICTVFFGLLSISPGNAMSQGVIAKTSVASQSSASSKAPYTSRKVTLDLHDVSIETAIRTIADRAGLMPIYPSDILPKKLITVTLKDVSVTNALARVLQNTGLSAELNSSGALGLVKIAQNSERRAQGIVTGKVTDVNTGKGVMGASVSVGAERGVTTGEDGTYRLTGITGGTHAITVRLVGYAKQTRSVTVGEGATVTIDFRLEPSANVLDQVVVTGTIAQTELKAIPNAITVITAKQIEERGITKIDQFFRGDIPGLFAQNRGSDPNALLDEVTMFSRGTTALGTFQGDINISNPIKTYIDGIELSDPKYLSQIDPKSIERIEILTGPQASTIYGSNAINGVMQIFTKRGNTSRPQLILNLLSGFVQNNFSGALTPQHDYGVSISGLEGRLSYNAGGSWNYIGPWTPAKQLARTGGFGGARLDLSMPAGHMVVDLSLRRTLTQSLQRGNVVQTATDYREIGWYTNISSSGLDAPTTRALTGQTFGLSLSYVPFSSWSHEFGLGQDVSDAETRRTARGYLDISDTTLFLSQSNVGRRSLRYATTARIPVSSVAQLMVTAGVDSWQSLTSSISASPQTLTGTVTNVNSMSRRPGHNTGGFIQSQLGIKDRLFLTYGLRMEKNPTIGEKARVIPGRYGAAYTHEFGSVTAKLRGSYGRSIRPPSPTLKDAMPQTNASTIALYGSYDDVLANPELTPEHQQGGEGGLELYVGTRGSLVITRYNQTVDQLIAQAFGVDSVRSLAPCPTTCSASSLFRDDEEHAFRRQSQYLNLGSIRNQGWELQGSIVAGPITTRGTYSWTKSRVIGVTPKYRTFFTPASYPQYQPGSTFMYLPEHTWALGVTYARTRSSVGFNVTGLGQATNNQDNFYFESLSSNIRLLQNRLNVSNIGRYINFNSSYVLADLIASHRFTHRVEGVLQVHNLADRYTNDYYAGYASLGRQIKLGIRVH